MRVTTGSAKGRNLKGPPSSGTRPMSDKIRQAVFSALASLGVEPDRVLDLYAGTGAIGIEALSRGANHADFVEMTAPAAAVIRENLERTQLAERGSVHRQSVQSYLHRKTTPYDLIILDPPYADESIPATLRQLSESALVQSGTVVVLGHWPRLELPERIGRLQLLKRRCHGDSCFSILEIVESEAGGDQSLAETH
ncbi:MAG TPA: 16S rRNA (guanine(966)-N(2))-methyltransferase RsmD [Thermomicrobiales bacterium]|nr:16S rRNA (guanine(966)-N(2))-methyltransferase RsmD [Thermomicrobiales bacterium]